MAGECTHPSSRAPPSAPLHLTRGGQNNDVLRCLRLCTAACLGCRFVWGLSLWQTGLGAFKKHTIVSIPPQCAGVDQLLGANAWTPAVGSRPAVGPSGKHLSNRAARHLMHRGMAMSCPSGENQGKEEPYPWNIHVNMHIHIDICTYTHYPLSTVG